MKELPYFKFYPSQWITGNISFLTFEEQGAFMKACCFYWAQECKLKTQQVKRIIKEELYNSLLDNGLIICFLDWHASIDCKQVVDAYSHIEY